MGKDQKKKEREKEKERRKGDAQTASD